MLLSSSAVGFANPFAGDIRRSPVDRFEHRRVIANVCASHDSQAANQSSGEIAHHVAVQIGQQQHVELLRVQHNLHARVIDDHFQVFNFREIPWPPCGSISEKVRPTIS